tara:strand:- start:4957 stop:10080 length:5124 start_codon:yes stop_codon:yes gene_type:complete
MAGGSSARKAVLLALLMVFGGPLQSMISSENPASEPISVLLPTSDIRSVGSGENAVVILPGANSYSTDFEIDVSSNAPVTDIHLSLEPSVELTQQGFTWNDSTVWAHSSAVNNGTFGESGALTGNGAGMLWDFNSPTNPSPGWTFSNSYSGVVTSPACGYNGSSGGSIRTYAGSTYATSPVSDFSGVSTMPLHLWVLEGYSNCGEEPDLNEDLQIQYRTATSTWTTLHTFSGSPSSSQTPTQYMTTLPAAALHTNSQIRFHQTSGSSTCCDYWFIDDVHFATPPSAEWRSPSIGFAPSSFQVVDQGPWAPLYIDATVPTGANLNWTILDGTTGAPLQGMTGSGAGWVPLNALDWQTVNSIRLHLNFEPSPSGEMASVHSISGDGMYAVSANSPLAFEGWTSNGGGINYVETSSSHEGTANDRFTSPWFTPSAALSHIHVSATTTLAQAQMRTSPLDNWTNITLPYSLDLAGQEGTVGAYQIQFISASNSSTAFWQVYDFETGAFGGVQPANPTIDFAQDGVAEWGSSDARVGSWGWQDRFENGETSIAANPGISGTSKVKAWIPATELLSFCFSGMSYNGEMTGLNLNFDGSTIANWTVEGGSGFFTLEPSQLENLSISAMQSTSKASALGTYFVEIEFEVFGTGNATLSGLGVPYKAVDFIQAPVDSAFVLALNGARNGLSSIGGMHHIPIPMTSDTSGSLDVTLEGLNSSSLVELTGVTMDTDATTLTPSQRWQTMQTQYTVLSSAAATARLDVNGGNYSATWLLPLNGGSPIGTGDSNLVELHPDSAITSDIAGTSVTVNITFRMEPEWDDSPHLTASTRLMLSNGVLSIPASYTWGGNGIQGFENDLEIKSVTLTGDDGEELTVSDYYLMAGSNIDVDVRIGFEGVDSVDAFADDDALVEFYQGESLIANTTVLEQNMWSLNSAIPFTFGVVDWRFEITSLNGIGLADDSVYQRTFHIDSISPQVLETNAELYDHRTPSSTQTFQIKISDQPVLPSSIQAMVWREWSDDDNFDSWPDADEYTPMGLFIPNDLNALIGQYTLMIDDTGGSLGQKVSVYLVGTDGAGHHLENSGSNISGEQLFMYQLAVDGAPTVASNAFGYQDGKKPWLHPAMEYSFNVHIDEPNGGSDLSTVVVELASNQGSDPLPIQWDFLTGNCTTTSPHLIILGCQMLGTDGMQASPYDRAMTLSVDFELGWTTPDLGETRREPGIRVIDRAGQEVFRAFPEHRWRFSAAMEIPEQSVSLILSQGSLVVDGARLAPNSPFEIAGGVVFTETGLIPEFDCQVNVQFAGSTTSALSLDGIWSVPLVAPSQSMTTPLTWSIGCLSGQGTDTTEQESSVRWILVDGTGPEPVEVSNPRPSSVLKAESHEVRILLSEAGGLDVDSLELIWWVEEKETGDRLRNGVEALSLVGSDIAGLRLEVVGNVDLSEITPQMLENRLAFYIQISGRDLADNAVLGIGGSPAGSPVGVWDMEWLKPEFSLPATGVTYSRLLVEVGQTSIVTAYIENTGTLNGSVEVIFIENLIDGTSSTMRRTTVIVPKGGTLPVSTDWNPSAPGLQWVEVQVGSDVVTIGPSIDVRPMREESFTERVFGDVNPVLGTLSASLFIGILATLLVLAKRMTLRGGSKSEHDWDDYSSSFDDDEDEYEFEPDVEDSLSEAASVAAAQVVNAESDWSMGSDGYWWYHDKQTNEWWYKNAEGEIVKYS